MVSTEHIQNKGSATNDIPVYYSIGGTAQNGVDYSNLTGVATFFVSQGQAEIDIDPIADGLKPNQTVILTLIQNTNYLIDPANCSATNTLQANPQVYPIAFGDSPPPMCPNTTNSITLNTFVRNGLSLTYTFLTWPAHGILDTNGAPYVTYAPTNCYEGPDSFTFKVNDGEFTSAPATVTLTISDPVYASSPTVQTCRGGSVSFSLGSDNCGGTNSYSQISYPAHGTLSGTAANLTYTATGTNYTGMDIFNYVVYSECGDSATGTVSVTVGEPSLLANAQSVITGTNRPVSITLSATDGDSCTSDTNYYTYTVTSGPAYGTLSGSGANLIYTPNTNYEGPDSFQFTASDGVWTSAPATVIIYVVAGPVLYTECDPFGTAVQLDWNLDTSVQQDGLSISGFVIYRSPSPGGPYTAIATNTDPSQMYYFDSTAVYGQTNYYVVTFQAADSPSGVIVESPLSNQIKAAGYNPDDLIPADAIWDVVTNLLAPTNTVKMRAPFSSEWPTQYANLYPWPNTNWPVGTTWTNHITMVIPTNVVNFSNVQYSIAIDNQYWLYVNGAYVGTANNNNVYAVWSAFQPFPTNTLHYGSNNIVVGIQDWGGINYFSMVVTTNTCGWMSQ